MSTRATPAVSVGHSCSSPVRRVTVGRQLVVGLRAPLAAAANHGFSRTRSSRPGSSSAAIHAVSDAGLGAREHRSVGREDVGAADVRAVPVEADLVGEDGVDAVVAGQDVVQPRRPRRSLEQLLLRASSIARPARRARARRSVRARRPPRASSGSRAEAGHLGALQREDAPALEEVAVVADRRADPCRSRGRSTSHSYACRKRKNSS